MFNATFNVILVIVGVISTDAVQECCFNIQTIHLLRGSCRYRSQNGPLKTKFLNCKVYFGRFNAMMKRGGGQKKKGGGGVVVLFLYNRSHNMTSFWDTTIWKYIEILTFPWMWTYLYTSRIGLSYRLVLAAYGPSSLGSSSYVNLSKIYHA